MESGYYLDIIISFGFFLQLSWSNGHMIKLTCNKTKMLTSGNYPNKYDYNVNTRWNITAPTYKGIAVVFEEFSTERGYDVLGILDPETHFNSRNYSGQDLNVPPFLSTGSSVLVTFKSNGLNSYKGFRLALHCYNKSERTSNLRLENNIEANEGILEVLFPNPLNQWLPVCNESLNSNLAEFTCRQLGFPGVSHFGSEVYAQYDTSACASIVCDNSAFLLQQCTWNVTRADTVKASRLQCLNFAYRGCFPLPTNIATHPRSTDTDVGDCMYMCSLNSSELAAIMRNGCYCLNVSQSSINNETPDNRKCLEGDSSQGTDDWAFHHDVTGSCEHPGDVANGWWSSNSTYLGSRLTLTCQPGFIINGSKSIECKPNDASNKTVWDKKIPHCQSLPRTTLQPTDSESQSTTVPNVGVITTVLSLVFVGILAVIWMSLMRKQRRKVCGRFTKTLSAIRSGHTSSTDNLSLQSTMSNDEIKVEQPPPDASTQVRPESPDNNRGEERTSEDDVNPVESSVTSPSPEGSRANEYATVSDVRQENKGSSNEAARDLDKCRTRADAVLGGSDTIVISTTHPQRSLCGKSDTMKNRPLPNPMGGAIKPPVPLRKTQTITRQDQSKDTATSHSTSRQYFTPLNAARDKTQAHKKAPGGSTPYVKARGKKNRVERKLEESSLEAYTGSRKGSAGDLAPRGVSNVSSSACSIDHCPTSGTSWSTLGRDEESLCCKGRNGTQNNSNSVSHASTSNQDQLYSDIDEEYQQDKDQASTDMTGGAYGSSGRFDGNLKPASPVIQQASNPYNTLEPTNTGTNSCLCPEYEDIGNMDAKDNGDLDYDHLDFK